MVRTLGGTTGPPPHSARSRRIVSAGSTPRANSASARRRSTGHACEPGRRLGGRSASAARCEARARRRAAVRHPCASQSRSSVSTKSRPLWLHWNSGEACAAHSRSVTPCAIRSSVAGPRVRSAQIAHTGRLTDMPPALEMAGVRMSPVWRSIPHRCATTCAKSAPNSSSPAGMVGGPIGVRENRHLARAPGHPCRPNLAWRAPDAPNGASRPGRPSRNCAVGARANRQLGAPPAPRSAPLGAGAGRQLGTPPADATTPATAERRDAHPNRRRHPDVLDHHGAARPRARAGSPRPRRRNASPPARADPLVPQPPARRPPPGRKPAPSGYQVIVTKPCRSACCGGPPPTATLRS